jgi:D-glycero-alpha-D-manno-heptose-7-phosphate kinase
VPLARDLKAELQKDTLTAGGDLIQEYWDLNRRLTAEVSSTRIDGWYNAARKAGALGGKLLGAGSGGFLMFYAPRDRHEAVRAVLKELRPIQFGFEPQGSRIIFVHD